MLPTMILVSEVIARLDANPFDPSSVMVETRHVLKAIDIVALKNSHFMQLNESRILANTCLLIREAIINGEAYLNQLQNLEVDAIVPPI